ncbi:MAG: ABC transporter permease [Pseudomonadota bacterium]
MIRYFGRKLLTMAGTLAIVSALVFFIINLPPGDFISNQIATLQASGEEGSIAKAQFLREQYALDKPLWQQYFIWVGVMPGANGFSGLLQGDFGWSFEFDRPVTEVLGESIWLTIIVNFAAILFIYAVALPLGVIAAVYAGRWLDYVIAFVGYIGLATPNFLLALLLLYYGRIYLGLPIGGLMDPVYENQPWTWDKVQSVLAHLIIPTIVIGTSGTASMIRRLRANMLDEMHKPYVTTAKAKGLGPTQRLVRYPLRAALNPFVADIGNLLPSLISGSVLVSAVLSLPTLGPVLLDALRSQDTYLAGFILLFASALTLVGMLISDLLLALLDPRIRFGDRAR